MPLGSLCGCLSLSAPGPAATASCLQAVSVVHAVDLPEEARKTLVLIRRGGPFPYPRDGAIFANREGRPAHEARGVYREYSVKTPGSLGRGARRIIAAGGTRFWYTADHYRSFSRIVE